MQVEQALKRISIWICRVTAPVFLYLGGCKYILDEQMQTMQHTPMKKLAWELTFQNLSCQLISYSVISNSTTGDYNIYS